MSPAAFAEEVSGGRWLAKDHLLLMNQIAMEIAAGKIRRQLTQQPPQTGKSEFWSKYLPAWYLGNFPDRRVILGSYNAEYASFWGGEARDVMKEFGEEYFHVKVRQDQSSKSDWSLTTLEGRPLEGRMRTMGMDSGITGKPAELFLIDDPFKGWEEASSPAHREKVWKVYTSCVSTRQQPETAICLTFTPWNEDDLGGRLLNRQPGVWNVLRMPALAEEPVPAEVRARKKGYAALIGAPDPIGRAPGDPLWPERFDRKHYLDQKALDRDVFDALYQCNPHPPEGGMFKRAWFKDKIRTDVPDGGQWVRYWDKAASDGKGDYTCGALLMVKDKAVWVVDMLRERLAPDLRDQLIRRTCEMDNRMHPGLVTWGEHAGNDARESAANFVKNLMGFQAFTEGTANKNKETRAYPFASYCGAGLVYIKESHWVDGFLDELLDFPNGKHDDQVDSASGAFGKLALGGVYQPAQAGAPRVTFDPIEAIYAEQGAAW